MYKYLLFITFLITYSLAQDNYELLRRHAQSLTKKISVGMSTNEVKAAIGKPFAIEGGFPESDFPVIYSSFPKMVGQLNNSTWFYKFPPKTITFSAIYNNYFINNIPVGREIYESYKFEQTLYTYDNKIINPSMASSYKLIKDKRLKESPINRNETYTQGGSPEKKKETYIPILCVIFDKGTQVVAYAKVFFQPVN